MKLIAARFLMPTQCILLNIIRISTTLQLTTKVQPTSTRESKTQLKCALLKENVLPRSLLTLHFQSHKSTVFLSGTWYNYSRFTWTVYLQFHLQYQWQYTLRYYFLAENKTKDAPKRGAPLSLDETWSRDTIAGLWLVNTSHVIQLQACHWSTQLLVYYWSTLLQSDTLAQGCCFFGSRDPFFNDQSKSLVTHKIIDQRWIIFVKILLSCDVKLFTTR